MIFDVHSEPGRFEPTKEDSPHVGRACPGCGDPIEVGDRPALVNGIATDPENKRKAEEGKAHNVEAQVAHERCAKTAKYLIDWVRENL